MELAKQRQFAVQWHEGMLLSPQHFQQEQVYRENERLHELSLTNPYFWGLHSLDFEPSGILEGKLRIRSLYGMMPDGLIANYNEKTDPPLEVDLSTIANLESSGEFALIHLVVPIRTENAAYHQAAIQRFDSLPGAVVVDENTGENGVEVHRLSPRYSLYVGDIPPSRFVSMPLMRVKRDSDGTFRPTDYVPPIRLFCCKAVRSADLMLTKFERMVQAIRQKAIQLSGIATSSSSGLSHQERVNKRQISALLGSVLASLEMTISADVHPFYAYSTFCDAIGRLARLTNEPVPPRLPAYDHNNLRNCFNAVSKFLTELLASIKSQFTLLRFDFENEKFSIVLPKTEAAEFLTIEIRSRKGQSENSVMEFIKASRIVSDSQYSKVSRARLLGAKRDSLPTPMFEASHEQERIVIQVPVSDPNIILGERLIISSANKEPSGGYPESIWLYSSHQT
jgi:type VI secretion system protein ImpJ